MQGYFFWPQALTVIKAKADPKAFISPAAVLYYFPPLEFLGNLQPA